MLDCFITDLKSKGMDCDWYKERGHSRKGHQWIIIDWDPENCDRQFLECRKCGATATRLWTTE